MFRKGIQSEQIRVSPKFVSELFQIISNEFEKNFESRLMENGQESIRLNRIHSVSI